MNSVSDLVERNSHFSDTKWLCDFRLQQFKHFLQRGLPTRKEEAWKYTEIKKISTQLGSVNEWLPNAEKIAAIKKVTDIILTFINGHYVAALSQTETLPNEITFCALSQGMKTQEQKLKSYLTRDIDGKRFPFAQLNAAMMTDGVLLDIPENVKIKKPIYFLFVNTKQNGHMTNPRNLIIANANSQVTVIEDHQSDRAEHYFTNVVTDIYAEKGAKIKYYKLQNEETTATHVANIFIQQQQDSCVQTYFFSHGANLAREDLSIWQHAKGAESYLHGLYELTHDLQHIDHHVHIDHLAPHGTSAMLYKGILNKKSRAVFNGKVYVHKDAQQINAHQANHNILLSNDAEVNTKPELEIYADDVKCTHGATVGQLDQEALFYLRSRGINFSDAHQIITRAFLQEIYSKIEDVTLREYFQMRMKNHDVDL
jgi:Fe-S cluster assembly protein SufD